MEAKVGETIVQLQRKYLQFLSACNNWRTSEFLGTDLLQEKTANQTSYYERIFRRIIEEKSW